VSESTSSLQRFTRSVKGYGALGALLLTMFLLCRLGAPEAALARFTFVVTARDRRLLADLVHAEPDDPESWLHGLVARGITHLWVNYAELDRLWQGRFSDPVVTPELVRAFAESHARPVAHSGNSTLYELVPHR
jgi:hypothetical protein